ncbi:MAG: hypothetical protein ACLFQP_00015 [Halothece sp.]
MARIHFFIDGTWLFKVCGINSALSNRTALNGPFRLDWTKFDSAIKEHIEQQSGSNIEMGERVIVTSIFTLPDDFNDWPNRFPDITVEQVSKTQKVINAREYFIRGALNAGYLDIGVLRPEIERWIIHALGDDSYREKQVDTTVVALLVKSAITRPDDYHVMVAGDADMIPAIRVAYPDYTKNVLIVSTHPDELDRHHRQSSFSYFNFTFDLPPFYLQTHADKIIWGNHVYNCIECGKIFSTGNPIPERKQPRCRQQTCKKS